MSFWVRAFYRGVDFPDAVVVADDPIAPVVSDDRVVVAAADAAGLALVRRAYDDREELHADAHAADLDGQGEV